MHGKRAPQSYELSNEGVDANGFVFVCFVGDGDVFLFPPQSHWGPGFGLTAVLIGFLSGPLRSAQLSPCEKDKALRRFSWFFFSGFPQRRSVGRPAFLSCFLRPAHPFLSFMKGGRSRYLSVGLSIDRSWRRPRRTSLCPRLLVVSVAVIFRIDTIMFRKANPLTAFRNRFLCFPGKRGKTHFPARESSA